MIAALKGKPVDIEDFEFRILAKTATIEEARELETAFLETFWGDWLYNKAPHANGSSGVKRDHAVYSEGAKKQWADPEARAKRAELTKKQWEIPGMRERLKAAAKARWERPDQKEMVSRQHLGTKQSEETKEKKRKALANRVFTPEHRAALKQAWVVRRAKNETK